MAQALDAIIKENTSIREAAMQFGVHIRRQGQW